MLELATKTGIVIFFSYIMCNVHDSAVLQGIINRVFDCVRPEFY